ncbi:MAG: DUF4293 family protein [Bacteroidales bacterium]|nr:MAG: DUF4293 family protein [Bacteroidales bacterium]
MKCSRIFQNRLSLQKRKIMIQRIQTVYLLASAILISVFYFLPFASFVVEHDMSMYHLSIKGLVPDTLGAKPLFRVIPLIIIISIVILTSIATIALFKRRMLQIRLSITNIILLLGLQGLMFYYISVSKHQLGAHSTFSVIFIFPLISAIFIYLAIRRIAKDEALVRSMDRLR